MATIPHIIRERYKIIKEIARGGMGIVYLARDLLTNSNVALKTSSWASEQKTREAFEIEAKLLARLDHPGLPKVRDYFLLDDNFQALVMDFIEGETLSEVLKSDKYKIGIALDANIVTGWCLQILDILRYLHGFTPPVIHRDIKPNNLTLKPDGTIVLLDFGLAKGTALSTVSGGSSYSSLEQLNLAATDARSDIYALAATLYHLLTNSSPLSALYRFQGICGNKLNFSGDLSDKNAFQADPQKSVAEVNPQVPPEISAVVMKAMSLFPEARFQTAEEMKFSLLLAKNNIADSSIKFEVGNIGAKTQIGGLHNSESAKSVLDDDEENLAAWMSKKDDDFHKKDERTIALVNSAAGEIGQTQLSIPENKNEKTGESNLRHSTNDDFTTFEIQRLPEKRPVHKVGKKLVPLIFGILAIVGLSLLGLVAWQFLAPKRNMENANVPKSSQSLISPASEPVKKPIEVSTYLVKNNGRETKLDENHLFENEEQFRFGVKSENRGFLYVISRNNQDKAQLTYPKQNQVDNSIEKDSEKPFPPDNGKFAFNKDSPSEMWAYFVVVASREDDLAKQIRITLGNNQEKNLSLSEVGRLLKDLDEIAEESAKNQENKTDSTKKISVVITKLQKKE